MHFAVVDESVSGSGANSLGLGLCLSRGLEVDVDVEVGLGVEGAAGAEGGIKSLQLAAKATKMMIRVARRKIQILVSIVARWRRCFIVRVCLCGFRGGKLWVGGF